VVGDLADVHGEGRERGERREHAADCRRCTPLAWQRDARQPAIEAATLAHNGRGAKLVEEGIRASAIERPPRPRPEAREDVHLQVIAVAPIRRPGFALLCLEEARGDLGNRHVGIAPAGPGLRDLPQLRLQQRRLRVGRRVEEPAHAAERAKINEKLLAAVAPNRARLEPLRARHQRTLCAANRGWPCVAMICLKSRAIGGRIGTSPRSQRATELLVTPSATASSTWVQPRRRRRRRIVAPGIGLGRRTGMGVVGILPTIQSGG
jgi:hypothetical protein